MFDLVSFIPRAISQSIPLLYGSTGEPITEKSGNLNLGIPGIMCIGAVGGCIGANMAFGAGMGAFGTIFFAILFAMLFGGAMGLIYGWFTISLRCNQNITGLTITTFGAGVLGFWGAMMGSLAYYVFYRLYNKVSPPVNYISSQYTTTGYSNVDIHNVMLVLMLTLCVAVICALFTMTGSY